MQDVLYQRKDKGVRGLWPFTEHCLLKPLNARNGGAFHKIEGRNMDRYVLWCFTGCSEGLDSDIACVALNPKP